MRAKQFFWGAGRPRSTPRKAHGTPTHVFSIYFHGYLWISIVFHGHEIQRIPTDFMNFQRFPVNVADFHKVPRMSTIFWICWIFEKGQLPREQDQARLGRPRQALGRGAGLGWAGLAGWGPRSVKNNTSCKFPYVYHDIHWHPWISMGFRAIHEDIMDSNMSCMVIRYSRSGRGILHMVMYIWPYIFIYIYECTEPPG